MKLNPDCIRDLLLIVEKHSTFSNAINHKIVLEEIDNKYTSDEVYYHIRQCELSGLFLEVRYFSGGFSISDLTPAGHEFINNIREDTNWRKTKNIAKSAGSNSLNFLMNIAVQVIADLISKKLSN